ncbi:DUF2777 domain-containing protein [Bacillus sp. T33-2]|uniref:DUF2777 domain-containing protein n=1 Tax=Bacillus sp. T33-2 TaxID=2054168 RepID=UPI000C758F57|nr:DUF2777 domain-containing protein [Bacillus sp. T33-2]PLR97665.1 DUF2777 domain-containing protein [Bacillus sp. T33-2]
MNQQQRLKLLEYQQRAFNTGAIEYINKQWVFFDEETEEAVLLEDLIHQEIEVMRQNKWQKGYYLGEGTVQDGSDIIQLEDRETIKIKKQLVYSLERLLSEINGDTFVHFLTTLNSLNFSIYDCIYCYNHLTFQENADGISGVNFIIFDNEEMICSVQHHFDYYEHGSDRFEFTLSSGKRTVIEKIL